MLYVDASILLSQDMATPKELVEEELERRKWSKAKLMKTLGYSTGFADFYSLFVKNPHQLTKEKRIQIAEVLGKPRDWLMEDGDARAQKREIYIRREYKKYLASPAGRVADPETHKILESMQWNGKYLPDERLYVAVSLVMEGRYTAEQVLDALQLEDDDRKAEQDASPPQAPRRSRKPR